MKFVLVPAFLSLLSLTACVNHYYNLSMEGKLQEIPDAQSVMKALKEDKDVAEVQYQHYPPTSGGESAFDRAVGTSGDHSSDTFLIQARDGRNLQLSFQVDQNEKTVELFQQEWQAGEEFQDKELVRLMAALYGRLQVQFPSLPPFEALKQKIENGSAH
jgi:hypothetical protein